MNIKRLLAASALITVMIAGLGMAQTVMAGQDPANSRWRAAKRQTLAIAYNKNDNIEIRMAGSSVAPRAMGKATVKQKDGHVQIKLEMTNLGNPQAIGPYYTTFALWAITAEGTPEYLAEIPVQNKVVVAATTKSQTFGLLITAEPHLAIKLPSPMIVAENTLPEGTKGNLQTSRIDYSGDPGTYYATTWAAEPGLTADYKTPLLILGARRAVDIARRASASEAELRESETQLAALELLWPGKLKSQETYTNAAQNVMRSAEKARMQAVERGA